MEQATAAIIFTTSFGVGLSGALMPGPLLTLDVSESARRGFKAGPLIVLGHGTIELAMVFLLAVGLSSFLERDAVAATIGLLGGAFLLWMGYGLIRARGEELRLEARDSPRRGGRPLIASGALISAANPYWVLWWATVGATYVSWSLDAGVLGLASFFSGHILSDLSWYGLIALVVAGGRRAIPAVAYRGVLVVCGVFLLGLGAYFVYSGVNFAV
jgi:threonine/homoserine/homoserine lactone efflux protein